MESTPDKDALVAFLSRVDQQISHARLLAESSGDDRLTRKSGLWALADLLATKVAVEEKLRVE